MKTTDFDVLDEAAQQRLTRRKALLVMGVTGVALAEGQGIVRAQGTAPAEAEVAHSFATVATMQKATGLREGMLVQTLGYGSPSDGGGAFYQVAAAKADEAANGGDIIALAGGLHARLLGGREVNYAMFGAVGDGKNDDGVQIKMAHEYANRHKLPIVNPKGEYWINQTNGIPIRTSVNWGQSIFHINEKFNVKNMPRFRVLNDAERKSVELDEATKSAILAALKPGVQVIPELAPYKNCLIQVLDSNDKIGFRAGANFTGQAWSREELFYVEEHGRIIGDIAWQFKNFTQFNVTPCSDSYLTVEGGGFYLSGDNPGEKYSGYYHNGIQIMRSRTIVRNQWMGLEPGKADISMEPRHGFYVLSQVYDVTLENIRLIPWEQNRGTPEKNVGAGTYGISGGRMLNCTFRGLTAEGGWAHWGVFGTNVNKNFRIENCDLNRVDVHFHCWNLTILDSTIGFRGISVTGGGHLWIENTIRHGNQFINFRSDFGAMWNGDINIRNCRLQPNGNGVTSILRNVMSNWNYGYPVGSSRAVSVEDFIVDFSAAPESKEASWLMEIVPFSKAKTGERLFFPQNAVFRNIQVVGREQGMRLVQIPEPGSYDVGRDGGYDGVFLNPNSRIVFENIHLEKIAPALPQSSEQVHLRLAGEATRHNYEDARSLYPQIRLSDCANLCAHLGGSIADVTFERCSVDRLVAEGGGAFRGRLAFSDCRFAPTAQFTAEAPDNDKPFYALNSELGTFFTNCTVHVPSVGGAAKPELLNRLDFVQLNQKVRFYHSNTALGNDILSHCKSKNIKLSAAFVAMLRSHHTLESETVPLK